MNQKNQMILRQELKKWKPPSVKKYQTRKRVRKENLTEAILSYLGSDSRCGDPGSVTDIEFIDSDRHEEQVYNISQSRSTAALQLLIARLSSCTELTTTGTS